MNELNERPEFRPEIESCIAKIKAGMSSGVTDETKDLKKYVDELMQFAKEEKDDRLFGYTYYYLMEYYGAVNDRVNTLYHAVEGMKYQLKSKEYYMVAKSWYMLGIYTVFLGSSAKTVECFLTCVDYCEKYGFDRLHFMACNRLADIFRDVENYEKALEYFEKAKVFYDNLREEDMTDEYAYLYCNMGYCYLALDKKQEAVGCKEKVDMYVHNIEKANKDYPKFLIHTFFATLQNKLGNFEQMEKNLAIAKEKLEDVKDYYKYWKDIESYVDLLESLERKVEAADLIDYYVTRCAIENAGFDIFELVLKKGIKCAIKTADNIRYISYSRRYFDMIDAENVKKAQRISETEKVHIENVAIQMRKGKKTDKILF